MNQYTWYLSSVGNYVVRTRSVKEVGIKQVRMHREVMKAKPGEIVDHINHNKSDNRKSNLRICTSSENSMNRKLGEANSSGVTGVGWNKEDRVWRVIIGVGNNQLYLGRYKKIDDAIKVRKDAEKKYFGEFAFTNAVVDEELYKRSLELEEYHRVKDLKAKKEKCPGVRRRNNKWNAQIMVQKKTYYLGVYNTKEEAVKARKDAEIELNVPEKFRC